MWIRVDLALIPLILLADWWEGIWSVAEIDGLQTIPCLMQA